MKLPQEPTGSEMDWDAEFHELELLAPDDGPPSNEEIEEEDRWMLLRQRNFRLAAEFVSKAWSSLPEVQRVLLFGSVAKPLRKEVPRFRKFRQARQKIWHECKDADLAVWLTRLDNLKALQQLRANALNTLLAAHQIGVAHHQVEAFIFEPGTDRLLGHLCYFGACPKQGKIECLVPHCGESPFLRQFPGFRLRRDALAPSGTVVLFDRQTGICVEPAISESGPACW